MPSLLDIADGKRQIDWFVVYYSRPAYFFWAKWLKQDFRHCDLWRPYYFGEKLTDVVWLRLEPTFESLNSFIEFDPTPPWLKYPEATVQQVRVTVTNFKV